MDFAPLPLDHKAAVTHAFTLHATDARAAYSPHNWIQRDADFPVRGSDPAG